MAKDKSSNISIIFYLFFACHFSVNAQQINTTSTFRIDTHIHLYDTNREGSATFLNPVKHKKVYAPHLVSEFLEVASPNGVDYAVVVEASARREDNYWAMKIVNQSDNMLAFIGNLDPRDTHYIQDLDSLSLHKKFRGIRLRPKLKIDISDPKIIDSFNELAKRNLVLELRANVEPIEAIQIISQRYPNMNIIIDHMAGGKLMGGTIEPKNWKQRLEKLASLPNVFIKISTLYSFLGASPAAKDYQVYKPFIDQVVSVFGTNRVLYGSNWTLSEMYGSYANLINIWHDYLDATPSLSSKKFYFENAVKAYGLQINK